MMNRIQVVLVRPGDGANVGAVCRAMKTMGVTQLAIAGPCSLDIGRVRTLAVHAFDIFESSRSFKTLEDAVEGSVLSAGITRRRGRFRKYTSFTPEQFIRQVGPVRKGTISLVFGNEEHGLTYKELKSCDTAVHIPSSDLFPSLNLSHAVQVILYILRTSRTDGSLFTPVSRMELEDLSNHVAGRLEDIGFFTLTGKQDMKQFFREIFARSHLSSTEVERLHKVFTKIERLKVHRTGLDKPGNDPYSEKK